MNIPVPLNSGKLQVAAKLVISQVSLSSTELVRCSYLKGNTYGPARPVTKVALHFYMYMIFLPTGDTHRPPRSATEVALLFYM
jgi:hypothetical protein